MIYTSNNLAETFKIAAEIAQKFKTQGGVIALSGDLGTGKTTFTQGFAKALGITDKIISPTFVLIRQHQVPNTKRVLYHVDLYRLAGQINVKELGLDEKFSDENNITLIEWAEKTEDNLPTKTLKIKIEKISDTTRKITVI